MGPRLFLEEEASLDHCHKLQALLAAKRLTLHFVPLEYFPGVYIARRGFMLGIKVTALFVAVCCLFVCFFVLVFGLYLFCFVFSPSLSGFLGSPGGKPPGRHPAPVALHHPPHLEVPVSARCIPSHQD